MKLVAYWGILSKRWWLVTATFVVTLLSSTLLSLLLPKVYAATTTLVVSPGPEQTAFRDQLSSISTFSQRDEIVATYAEVAISLRVFRSAAADLGIPEEQWDKYAVACVVLPSTNVIAITVEGRDPLIVRDLANGLGQQTIQYVRSLYEIFDLTILDSAIVEFEPVRPPVTRNVLLGGALGLALGTALPFLVEYVSPPDSPTAMRPKGPS